VISVEGCFLVFIKSFSLEQFSRVFTGIYQCLNLIHYALTVYSEEFFKTFLSDPKNMENLKSEFFIPLMVDKLINDGLPAPFLPTKAMRSFLLIT